jgi:hypothetical protein
MGPIPQLRKVMSHLVVTPPTTTLGLEALPRYKTIRKKGNRYIGINSNE